MTSGTITEMMILRNEFAAVRLELCTAANGPRLKIIDLDSGEEAYLDPFEIASLVWASPEAFDKLAMPKK